MIEVEVDGKTVERKIGLALSGGGFRASAFHMGVLRRLDELAILDKIDVVSTVSGGSIVGAYYVLRQGDPIGEIENGFRKALKANVRMRGLTGSVVFHPIEFGKALFSSRSRTNITATEYDRLLFHGSRLSQLPDSPRLVINATSLNSGVIWKFSKEEMGDYKYASAENPNLLIADAVGASAAVPGLFPPLVLDEKALKQVNLRKAYKDTRKIRLADGGVRDNQGLTSVFSAGCEYVICSDASGLFDEDPDASSRAISVLLRSNSIAMDAARDLLVQQLFARKREGTISQSVFFDLRDTVSGGAPGLPDSLVGPVARIRTDLDWFSDEEIETLMYHGYTLLDQKLKKYV
ncbi:MAG: hypothetical protein GY937_04345 [bacterium]|nr:hypothetical protein [bacterium]